MVRDTNALRRLAARFRRAEELTEERERREAEREERLQDDETTLDENKEDPFAGANAPNASADNVSGPESSTIALVLSADLSDPKESLAVQITGVPSAATLTGTALDEVIFGDADNHTLSGGDGLDNIQGFSGDDIINGGNGNDTIYGGKGNDTLNGTDGNDVLDYSNVVFTNINEINGGGGDYTLTGTSPGDTIYGGSTGTNTLTGGIDHVTDFDGTASGDILDLSDLVTLPSGGDINDFVSIQVSGPDSIVSFSSTAGGSLQQIAVLDGVTGLNVSTLFTA